MNKKPAAFIYYALLTLIGYYIFAFEIEKSFALITIYILCISCSFLCFLFNVESKKLLPVLFIVSLFAMYGVQNDDGNILLQLRPFSILLFCFTLFLFVLIKNYNLGLKKLLFGVLLILLAGIYTSAGDALSEFVFVPFVLGSFFMFRSISYLHEIKFYTKPIPLIDKINYFLLVPNFSMPLFPIVDYKTFVTSYTGINSDTLKKGTLFICRGVFQLLLYRLIYHYIIIPIDQIQTSLQLLIFLVANFLVILRVIAAFHIAIGLVILLGYNLPEIVNNLFFSTSFSDLWRRLNIYWLNFMLKVFYYPIYFKIKKYGVYFALFISTLLCFLSTWFLHTYQWFWLKGSFPIEAKDAVFWCTFGLLVSINTLIQQRTLENTGARKESGYKILRFAISGFFVLLTMSLLWSIWSSNSLQDWWTLIKTFTKIDLQQAGILFLLMAGYVLIASLFHAYEKKKAQNGRFHTRTITLVTISGVAVLLLSLQVTDYFFSRSSKKLYRTYFVPIISEKLNRADLRAVNNGYYTNLISSNNFCSQIWVNKNDVTRNWTKYITSKTTKPSFDERIAENIPFASVKFNGISFTLNSHGLRDKEYPLVKPDSCYRIIVLGGSYEIGNGMNDGEDYITRVENDLNEKYNATRNGKRVHIELINFSCNGYRLIQRLFQYKDNARFWNPDAMFIFIHTDYGNRIANYLNALVVEGSIIKDPYLKKLIGMKNIMIDDTRQDVRNKLGNYTDSLNYYAIDEIYKIAKEDSTNLIAVYYPSIKQQTSKKDSTFMATICSTYSIKPLDLSDVFSGHDLTKLTLSDLDIHPNKKANQLLSDKLLKSIVDHQDYFKIQFTKK